MLLFGVWALLALISSPGEAIWESFFSQYVSGHRWLVNEEKDRKSRTGQHSY